MRTTNLDDDLPQLGADSTLALDLEYSHYAAADGANHELTPTYDRLVADAELGRLVRNMPKECFLYHNGFDQWAAFDGRAQAGTPVWPAGPGTSLRKMETPEQALRSLAPLPWRVP